MGYAAENGLAHGIDPSRDDPVERVHELTEGMGADAVIITAATPSHQVVSDAMNACRKKGRVIVVGSVGLHLNRQDFYKKELDFLISCSYGPGRYDPNYEEDGQDYPLPYIRWTENRNMEAYLRLLTEGRIELGGLPSQTYPIHDAARAYEVIGSSSEKPLLVFLEYPQRPGTESRKTVIRTSASKRGRTRVAVVGAGGFAQGVHLPNLIKLRNRYEIRAIMSRIGSNAVNIARQYEAVYATTEFEEVLNDAEVDLIIICTRHNLHGSLALRALRAGKNVLVEKPLCIKPAELDEIKGYFAENSDRPVLTTGFMSVWLRVLPSSGYVPLDHWVHGEEGGGRNIGEACHIYDLFNFLVGAEATTVRATTISPTSRQWSRSDNFVATLSYSDGSVCTLTYTALGAKSYPKEHMEMYADSRVIVMDDFKSIAMFGARENGWRSPTPQKGHLEELQSLADCLQNGTPWPIRLEEQFAATETSFLVQEQIQ